MVNKWPTFVPKYHRENLQEAFFEILLTYFDVIPSSIKKSLQLVFLKGRTLEQLRETGSRTMFFYSVIYR